MASHPPPAKRARKANDAVALTEASATPAPAASGSTKAEDKKRKLQLKKIFDRCASVTALTRRRWLIARGRLKKECKSDSVKFQGAPRTIKIDEVLEPDEFQSIFGGKGTLIQPRPDNKPKSTVTIIEYVRLWSLLHSEQ